MTFDPLFEAVPQWRGLGGAIDGRLCPAAHGDFARWQAALHALPDLTVHERALGAVVTVRGPASANARQALRAALLGLHPWRKGPFRLFGVDIDCEWRSDWKWQRVAPYLEPLAGRRVLDVGCGNGYFGWRMLAAGAALVAGVDPMLVFHMQHRAVNKYLDDARSWVVPLGFEDLPIVEFDTVFSMGVIYHRRDPAGHARRLFDFTRPGGQVVVESLIVQNMSRLEPRGRYARMPNISVIPSPDLLCRWLADAGFQDVTMIDVTRTKVSEQRSTAWMHFQSLAEALDPDDRQRTVEGYPAPVRGAAVGRRPD